MAEVPAADVKAGDIIFNRRLRGGRTGEVDRALDGDALVVLEVAWPVGEDGRGRIRTRKLGGGAGPTLRPRRWDQVERTAGL